MLHRQEKKTLKNYELNHVEQPQQNLFQCNIIFEVWKQQILLVTSLDFFLLNDSQTAMFREVNSTNWTISSEETDD